MQRGRVLKRNTKKFLVWFSKRLIKPVRLLQCRCRWKRCLFQLHVIAIRLGVSRVSSDPGFYERYTNRTEPNELEKKRFKKKKKNEASPPLVPSGMPNRCFASFTMPAARFPPPVALQVFSQPLPVSLLVWAHRLAFIFGFHVSSSVSLLVIHISWELGHEIFYNNHIKNLIIVIAFPTP